MHRGYAVTLPLEWLARGHNTPLEERDWRGLLAKGSTYLRGFLPLPSVSSILPKRIAGENHLLYGRPATLTLGVYGV